jgi:predicted O-linked N-acetylglucosamine transferase (SPINDLY family)
LLATCQWQELAPVQARAIDLVRAGKAQRIPPFQFLRLSDDPALQCRAATDFSAEREKEAKINGPTFTHAPAHRQRLRIGYLSADFRDHAIAQLLVEVIEKHDRTKVETFGYSLGPGDGSALRRRLMHGFEHFVDLGSAPARAGAARIHRDGIDILIDLMGYTEGARPDLLALRPAPLRAAYLGYPGTSGARFIDYVIADGVAIPQGAESNFSEAIVRLARCYQPADSRLEIAGTTPSRTEEGLPETGVVFCCFNNSFKLAPETFDLWLDLLKGCPGSVLWLLEGNAVLPAQLRTHAQSHGIAGERLVFARRTSRALHLARHRLADLFLDTSPYGAHTTASDALRLGVPVVTAPGAAFASRVAASLLHHLGLHELIATDKAGYRAIALALAHDSARRLALRASLVERLSSASWLDAGDHARQLETAYRRMWEIGRAGGPPASFSL